jgi:hypothetical protein
LLVFVQQVLADAGEDPTKLRTFPLMAVNAVRMLLAVSPEKQTA